MNCIVWVCEGSKGVGAWFGAPNTQRTSSLSRACNWHFVCVHVRSRSHSGTVCCWLVLLRLHALISVIGCACWLVNFG